MQRRTFLQISAGLPAAVRVQAGTIPQYRVVTRYPRSEHPGMPGAYPGFVVSAHSDRSIDVKTERADPAVVAEMMARGMRALTGTTDVREAWKHFFSPSDVVGIKLNCSGAPGIMSDPHVVADIVKNLIAAGVKPANIYPYERFQNQVRAANYERYLAEGVRVVTAEGKRGDLHGYDPFTYVEVNFFGEEDTRSHLIRLVSERFTKIINVPNMKDHGASGVTGCLKNIAYGNFSNVARSHADSKTHTLSFVGTLANVEPVRSRTVLQIMDGLKGVWHGGPFSPTRRFRFFPKQILFGTDPVAIDRLLLDVIDKKRAAEGARSVWDRSPESIKSGDLPDSDPSVNRFFREPGHIEYAASLGLGVYERGKIRVENLEVA